MNKLTLNRHTTRNWLLLSFISTVLFGVAEALIPWSNGLHFWALFGMFTSMFWFMFWGFVFLHVLIVGPKKIHF